MGSEQYGISTYGKTYLIDEGIKEYSTIRYIYILANVLMLLGATAIVSIKYVTLRTTVSKQPKRNRPSMALLTSFFVAFMVNNLIRGSHMIDHICRPVYYHEPRWAYEKIWITEMEVPTYANVFVQGLGLVAILKVMEAVIGTQRKKIVNSLIYMGLFIPASAFNIIHYTIEPPRNYGPFPNFNISGSAISTIPLALLIVYASRTFKGADDESTEQLLKSSEVGGDRKGKVGRGFSQARRRSKTPVKE